MSTLISGFLQQNIFATLSATLAILILDFFLFHFFSISILFPAFSPLFRAFPPWFLDSHPDSPHTHMITRIQIIPLIPFLYTPFQVLQIAQIFTDIYIYFTDIYRYFCRFEWQLGRNFFLLRNNFDKDTHRENARTIQGYTKITKMGIWVISRSPLVLIGPFCTSHSICYNTGFWEGSFVWKCDVLHRGTFN